MNCMIIFSGAHWDTWEDILEHIDVKCHLCTLFINLQTIV